MIRILVVVLFCSCFSGCGSGEKLYRVTGKIVFEDGTNARFGSVESRSDTVPPVISRGTINKDGTFELRSAGKGLPVGTHKVVVAQFIHRSKAGFKHNHGHEVADKYRSYESSKLEIKVNADNKNHFELTLEARKK